MMQWYTQCNSIPSAGSLTLELSDKSSSVRLHNVSLTASSNFEIVDTYTGRKSGCEMLDSDVSSTVTDVGSPSVVVI